jgi:hypothetical protein
MTTIGPVRTRGNAAHGGRRDRPTMPRTPATLIMAKHRVISSERRGRAAGNSWYRTDDPPAVMLTS